MGGTAGVPSSGDWGSCATKSYKATLPNPGDEATLIHRNNYREYSKMMRQRNMSQMEDWEKYAEKVFNEMDAVSLPDRVYNTGYKDAQET